MPMESAVVVDATASGEPVPAPVVPSLRIVPLPALLPLMPALPELLVVGELLVGPLSEPALPWLDWANAPPADRARMQADVRTIFFIVISLGFEVTLQPSSSNSVPAQLDAATKFVSGNWEYQGSFISWRALIARRKPAFLTSLTASRGATQMRLRWCFSGQVACLCLTSSGKMWTSQITDCLFFTLRLLNLPTFFVPTAPLTPASS